MQFGIKLDLIYIEDQTAEAKCLLPCIYYTHETTRNRVFYETTTNLPHTSLCFVNTTCLLLSSDFVHVKH